MTYIDGKKDNDIFINMAEDTTCNFENKNNTVVPTEVRFSWLSGLPLMLISLAMIGTLLFKKVKRKFYD